MPQHDFFADPDLPGRYARFAHLFRATDALGRLVNQVLDEEGHRMEVREGEQRFLSLIVGTALGRGSKDFQAILRLCLLGFGEQAMVVLRSSVNLLINISYIVGDTDPDKRADEFLAFSHRELTAFLRDVYGAALDWTPDWPPEEYERKANAWKGVGIRRRALRLPQHHYNTGYRFYSSIEHADVTSLVDMIERVDPTGPFVNSGPSDEKLKVTLYHAYMVLADLLHIVCGYHGIDRPDVFEELRRVSADVAAEVAAGGKDGN